MRRAAVFLVVAPILAVADWVADVLAGNRLRSEGRFAEAREEYRRALGVLERSRAGSPEMAAVLNNLGTVEDDLGNDLQAEWYYERSIAVWTSVGNRLGLASPVANLALLRRKRGDYAAADRLYREALELRGPSMGLMVNLGRLAMLRGRYDDAEAFYESAAALAGESQRAILLANRAELNLVRGRLKEAELLAAEALELVRDRPLETDVRLTLAGVESERRAYPRAAEHLARAAELSERHFGPRHAVTACAYAEYAGVLRKLKRRAEADQYRDRALEIVRALPERHTVRVSELMIGR